MTKTFLVALFGVLAATGCKKDGGGDGEGLSMSSSSASCKKAMSCCEKMVEIEKGKKTPEDINLKCSGVALATTDTDCDAFRQGYVASLEGASKPVPAECK